MPGPDPERIPWRPIEPLGAEAKLANGMLAALDALRDEWARRLGSLSEKERARVRQRSLRRLSVETGILERLYDLEWGLTLTLVAEGFTRDVVERAGGRVDDRTLATLRAQMDSLELVLDFVRQQRSLSASFIKELHQAITRTQDTYVVTDSLGRVVEAVLPRGQWKSQPNHVLRQDNTLLEYAPPEQVASEIDRLVALWSDLEAGEGHPIVKAAWLHHRFVQIHPFADGNGRVARALTLLVIEKYHYAPLVVDRWHRDAYLRCLKAANDGNLADLVRLFAKLEGGALTGELERPPEIDRGGVAVRVAHTLAAQLVEARRSSQIELQQRLVARALAVGGRLRAWFDGKREELSGVFAGQGLTDVAVFSDSEMPPTPLKTHWFRWQVTESAHAAGHYADFSVFTGWASLRIRLDSWLLRYVASLHGAGRDPGVMAVTTFAEIEPVVPTPEDEAAPRRQYVQTTADAFRFVHAESAEHIHDRAQELEDLLDEGLAVALLELRKRA